MGIMKDSSLLRWTQNKNNINNNVENKQTASAEKEKKKSEKSKKWLHKPENLSSGPVAFLVKFLGSTVVDQPKGIEVVKEGIRKLKFNQQLKKSEGTKTPKVELTISVDGLAVLEPKSKKIQHQYPLHRISYCADDKAEKRFFSFIAAEPDSATHTCYVFVSDRLAEEITLTMGQAFDLAYTRFIMGRAAEPESQKIARLERETNGLRERLLDLASMLEKSKLVEYMEKNNILELGLVDEVDIDEALDSSKENCSNVMENSVDSAIDTRSCRHMNFHATPAKDATINIEDLNDDDFDPRSSSQCNESLEVETHDVNPKSTPGLRNHMNTPSTTPLAHPSQVLPPPSLPPRDLSKILTTPSPTPPVISCPFGMDNFDSTKVPFSSPFSTAMDFSLDELDPLRN